MGRKAEYGPLDPAVVSLTPGGLELARRIVQALGHGEVIDARADVRKGVRDLLTELYQRQRPLVCIMALGIVVRIIGPVTGDKRWERGVVVVDEAGKFAISVLNGHQGMANQLAKQVAKAIGATPVVTTASESLGLPVIDLLGRELGWRIENPQDLTRVSAAMVRGEPIGVYQDAGKFDWAEAFGAWPRSFRSVKELESASKAKDGTHLSALVVITDRIIPPLPVPAIIYRPPTIVAGVGCRRGTSEAEIEKLFQEVCQRARLSPLSLSLVATATLKQDEPGLLAFARRHGTFLRCFTLEMLAAVGELQSPSAVVRQKIGIDGVCEPAAMLAASTSRLLVPKTKSARATIALAYPGDA